MTDAATWSERYAATAQVWDTTPNQFVVTACRTLRPGRALDLGAGEGRNALWLAGRGWQVTAVDFAAVAVGRIQSRSALQNRTVDAIVGDALDYRPAPASFDLVLLSYLQLPEAQLERVLANVVPGLAVGGRVLVVAHDASNIDEGWGGPRNPEVLTTAGFVGDRLARLGLTVLRAEVVGREVPYEVGFRVARDHVVEAIRSD